MSDATVAKLLLVALAFCWGLSWTAMRVALDEVSPWAMRLIGYSIGSVTLLVAAEGAGPQPRHPARQGLAARFHRRDDPGGGFGVAGTFAQLMANTSRVIIVNYSMPVWGSLMAYVVLREKHQHAVRHRPRAVRRGPRRAGLSGGGEIAARADRPDAGVRLRALLGRRHRLHEMGAHQGRPAGGLVLAGRGRRRRCSPSSIRSSRACRKFEPLQWRTWDGLLFNGILGTGIAYFIWFNIIGRLSTAMASLGALINPVVGVIGAVIILGDRPTVPDIDRLRADLQRRRLRDDPAAPEAAARPGAAATCRLCSAGRSLGLRRAQRGRPLDEDRNTLALDYQRLCRPGVLRAGAKRRRFLQGQELDLYIGYSVGGGYDLYARLLARYLGKHIPGNPTVLPQNMPGAGSLRLTNWLYGRRRRTAP